MAVSAGYNYKHIHFAFQNTELGPNSILLKFSEKHSRSMCGSNNFSFEFDVITDKLQFCHHFRPDYLLLCCDILKMIQIVGGSQFPSLKITIAVA